MNPFPLKYVILGQSLSTNNYVHVIGHNWLIADIKILYYFV